MPRIFLALALALLATPGFAVAQEAGWFVGGWQAEVRDPVQGTARIDLLLGNDGSYQRSYKPQAYFGMVHDSGSWAYQDGVLQLRWREYTVIPQPMYPPLQQGTDTFIVTQAGADAFRFRSPACTDPACWGTMLRAQ